MKSKTVAVDCDPRLAQGLAAAVRAYVDAAYPAGGSECAQVARAALLDAARDCAAHAGGPLVLRRRMMPQLRAAVHWCLSQDDAAGVELPPGLESVLTPNSKSA